MGHICALHLIAAHPLHLSGRLNLVFSQEESWLLSLKVSKALGYLPYIQRTITTVLT